MIRARHVLVVASVLLVGFATSLAQPPRPTDENPITVLVEKGGDALRGAREVVVMTPEQYRKLLEKIETLNQQLKARPAGTVSMWKVTGKMEGRFARLRVSFRVNTERENAVVVLGCARANATNIQLDKDTTQPLLGKGPDGHFVEIEKQGTHDVYLDLLLELLEMPAASTAPAVRPGPDRPLGFDLDLPTAHITDIDLELPPDAKNVRLRDLPAKENLKGNRLVAALGRADKLKVVWQPPQAVKGPIPVLTARGEITVRLNGPQNDLVRADLTLQDLGRSTPRWELQLPPGARVRLANPAERERLKGDIRGNGSPDGRVTLELAAPTSEQLGVVVEYTRPRASSTVPLGPFNVEGATTQTGVIWIVAGSEHRISCRPWQSEPAGFSVVPRSISGEPAPPNTSNAFQYAALATAERVDPRDPWFRLDIDAVPGQLEASVEHVLRLEPALGRNEWRLTTTFKAQSRRAEVERLELDWPAPWVLDSDRSPRPRDIASVIPDAREPRRLRLRLDSNTLNAFEMVLEAQAFDGTMRGDPFPGVPEYPYPSLVARLPRPLAGLVFDRGGHTVTVTVPTTHDLRVPQPPNPGLELIEQKAHQLRWRADRLTALEQVALAWKPYRPQLGVDSLLDAVVSGRQVEIKQRLRFAFEEKSAERAEVELNVPPGVKRLAVLAGGKPIEAGQRRPGTLRCTLNGAEGELVLQYATALADTGVPLVTVGGATHGQMRVRVWAPPGGTVRTPQDTWEELKLEVVEDQERLPALVLGARQPSQALLLRVEQTSARARAVLVERILVQVRMSEGGLQNHRVRFLLRQLPAEQLDLLFPVALDREQVQVTLDGVALNGEEVPAAESDGRSAPTLLRLRLPQGSLRRPAALEVNYALSSVRGAFLSGLQSPMQPVTIAGLLAGVPVCWQVDLPGQSVPLSLDAGDGTWRWSRRGWLLAPRPALNAGEVERWFWGEGDPRGAVLSEEEASLTPGFVGWRGSLGTLTLYHVPQQAWLLACSLIALVVGLGLGQAALGSGSERKRVRWFWPVLIALVLGIGVAGLVWPSVVSAFLYGAQPGLAVVLVVLGVQWLLHERYRRRVVFLPGFRRVKTGSSLVRGTRADKAQSGSAREAALAGASGSGPRRNEPSTVDAPPGEAGV